MTKVQVSSRKKTTYRRFLEAQVTTKEKSNDIFLSQFGEQVVDEIVRIAPLPVLLIGATGWGKSVLVREIANRLNRPYYSINSHPGMDINLLVGMWRPSVMDGAISIAWEDGILTKAIRSGSLFLMEEMTRAPQEMTSRLFGLLDGKFRYWSLPEAGIADVPVHENFMLLGTANPMTQGYNTQRLDKALHRRFAATYEINKPLADEKRVLLAILKNEVLVSKLVNFLSDARSDEKTNINTGDMVLVTELISRNLDPQLAVARALSSKYPESAEGLKLLAKTHF